MMKILKSINAKRLAIGGTLSSMAASGMAFAQADTTLSTAVTGELAGGKAEILAVGAAVLILVGVVALVRHVRAAAR